MRAALRSEAVLRHATIDDQHTIIQMIHAAGLDRSSLHWSHFIVAEMPNHGIVGVGQIRPYRRNPELGSILVLKPYRQQGIAGQIIRALQASHPAPLYLVCLGHNVPYYARFGFRQIRWYQAPFPWCLKPGFGAVIAKLGLLRGETVAAMRWNG